MNKTEAGVSVARQLRTAEHALDEALAQSMTLAVRMIEARKASHFAAELGHETLGRVIEGVTQMHAARGAIVVAHGDLLQIAETQNVRWRLDGATESKPVPIEPKVAGLTLVA